MKVKYRGYFDRMVIDYKFRKYGVCFHRDFESLYTYLSFKFLRRHIRRRYNTYPWYMWCDETLFWASDTQIELLHYTAIMQLAGDVRFTIWIEKIPKCFLKPSPFSPLVGVGFLEQKGGVISVEAEIWGTGIT